MDSFKICLRGAKIFDGPHKGIKVVSKFDFLLLSFIILINKALPKNCISSKRDSFHDYLQWVTSGPSSIFRLFHISLFCTSIKQNKLAF